MCSLSLDLVPEFARGDRQGHGAPNFTGNPTPTLGLFYLCKMFFLILSLNLPFKIPPMASTFFSPSFSIPRASGN